MVFGYLLALGDARRVPIEGAASVACERFGELAEVVAADERARSVGKLGAPGEELGAGAGGDAFDELGGTGRGARGSLERPIATPT